MKFTKFGRLRHYTRALFHQVKNKVLKVYGEGMSGLDIRLKRLFSRGKAFIVALDHGLVMGHLRG